MSMTVRFELTACCSESDGEFTRRNYFEWEIIKSEERRTNSLMMEIVRDILADLLDTF